MTDADVLIPVGKIIGTHGIKGLLKVHSFSGNIESLQSCRTVTVKSATGALARFELKSVVPHAGKLMIGLQGLDDINLAEPLVGSEICLLRSQLPEPEDNEYYWCDLIGLQVATLDGRELGSIVDIFETGSSDIYVVRSAEREYLIPAIGSVVSNIDLKTGRMLVTPLEGLLDL
jgi:16S rRNA processing protein RimM